MRARLRILAFAFAFGIWALPASAHAAGDTDRDTTWQTTTTITMIAGVATTALMPRIFYADPQTTAGWKARWHVSVLAPTLANVSLTLLNEYALKDAIGTFRPGCDETVQGTGHCSDFSSLSSHTFLSFAAFGQGAATFGVDLLESNDGRFNVGSFIGNVGVPLVFAGVTAVGRSAGNWESGGTVAVSAAAGLGIGVITGLTYALLRRPECGYGGAVVCW